MRRPNLLVTVRNFLFGLFFAWLVLSPVPKNSSQMDSVGIGVQTISTIRAGSREEPTQNSVGSLRDRNELSNQVPNQEQAKNMPDGKVQESTSLPGEQIRYSPSGSSGGNNNPSSSSDEWICPKIPEPNEAISDDYFWNILEKSSEFDNNDSDDDIWDSEDWIQPELSSKSNLRRRLLQAPEPTPTAKLDQQNQKKFDFTTGPIPKFKYKDRDGREISMANKPLKKIAYSHATDLNMYNLANRIECPIQLDPNKFQRTNCWAMTDRSVRDVIVKVFELTTMSDPT